MSQSSQVSETQGTANLEVMNLVLGLPLGLEPRSASYLDLRGINPLLYH